MWLATSVLFPLLLCECVRACGYVGVDVAAVVVVKAAAVPGGLIASRRIPREGGRGRLGGLRGVVGKGGEGVHVPRVYGERLRARMRVRDASPEKREPPKDFEALACKLIGVGVQTCGRWRGMRIASIPANPRPWATHAA